MSTQLSLRCRCGSLRGLATDVGPSTGTRLVCMCIDCQAFAHFLGREDVLDRHGGTDIYQTTPSQLQLTEGRQHLACVRLSPKGMLRWYAGCCRTPIGNTPPSPTLPFVGLVHSIVDHHADGRTRDQALGAPRAYIHGQDALGGKPAHAATKVPFGTLLRIASQLIGGLLAGRNKPTPFFDTQTGKPVVEPLVLTLEQRQALA